MRHRFYIHHRALSCLVFGSVLLCIGCAVEVSPPHVLETERNHGTDAKLATDLNSANDALVLRDAAISRDAVFTADVSPERDMEPADLGYDVDVSTDSGTDVFEGGWRYRVEFTLRTETLETKVKYVPIFVSVPTTIIAPDDAVNTYGFVDEEGESLGHVQVSIPGEPRRFWVRVRRLKRNQDVHRFWLYFGNDNEALSQPSFFRDTDEAFLDARDGGDGIVWPDLTGKGNTGSGNNDQPLQLTRSQFGAALTLDEPTTLEITDLTAQRFDQLTISFSVRDVQNLLSEGRSGRLFGELPERQNDVSVNYVMTLAPEERCALTRRLDVFSGAFSTQGFDCSPVDGWMHVTLVLRENPSTLVFNGQVVPLGEVAELGILNAIRQKFSFLGNLVGQVSSVHVLSAGQTTAWGVIRQQTMMGESISFEQVEVPTGR